MRQEFFKVISNKPIARDTMELCLFGNTEGIREGQFVNIKINGVFLRRPLSVCGFGENNLTVVYRVKGKGTSALSEKQEGETLDLLVGLGNGFNTALSGETPLLIGGGLGSTPMYCLARKLTEEGKKVRIILGFASKADVFYEEKFKELGADVVVATADGSYGRKGFVTDVMTDLEYSHFFTCGPEAMFKAIDDKAKTSGQFSFEERMGCGFGACMGCTCKTKYGHKRICKDGPVLMREEIIW